MEYNKIGCIFVSSSKHNTMNKKELFSSLTSLCKMEFNVSETLQVISHNKPMYWSWGVTDLTSLNGKGLIFKVNGHHHKGWVLITLDWTDTYNVDIINNKGEVIQHYDMVYFDMLSELIDNRIERIPEYQH